MLPDSALRYINALYCYYYHIVQSLPYSSPLCYIARLDIACCINALIIIYRSGREATWPLCLDLLYRRSGGTPVPPDLHVPKVVRLHYFVLTLNCLCQLVKLVILVLLCETFDMTRRVAVIRKIYQKSGSLCVQSLTNLI